MATAIPIPCSSLVMDNQKAINEAVKRWQVAYVSIYSIRVMSSLYTQLVANNNRTSSSPPSSDAVDSEPDMFFSNLNSTSITKMVKDKDKDTLLQFGGVDGLVESLQTDEREGINGNHEDISRRQKAFGCNRNYKLTKKSFLHFVLEAVKDPIIVIFLVCSFLSLGFNIKESGVRHGWYDGGIIFIAVFVVVIVRSMSQFWPYRQFSKLTSQVGKENRIEVVRNGQQKQVSVPDIVVGDVVCLKSGNQVPADGLLLRSHSSLILDQSSLGASNRLVEVNRDVNPFLFSGTKVHSGHGEMLVTSVGENTKWSEIMSLLGHKSHRWRSLEDQLTAFTTSMGLLAISSAVGVLVVLLLSYFLSSMRNNYGEVMFIPGLTKTDEIWRAVIGILVSAVAVASSAIPEGLSLAMAIIVAYTMRRMMNNRCLFREFSTCVPLASASVICIDTTDILTVNQMEFKFWLGKSFIEQGSSSLLIPANVRHLLCQGIGLNPSQLSPEFSQTSIEEPIVCWAIKELDMNVQELKKDFHILRAETLIEETNLSKILIRKQVDNPIHVHLKGKAEAVLAKCSCYYGIEGIAKAIDYSTRRSLEQRIQVMANDGFKCIAFAHKVLKVAGESHQRLEHDSLFLLGLMGLKDPIQPGVTTAVKDCKQAGVNIKLITGEDMLTATAIATECGILDPNEELNNGEIMEASEFQNYTETERIEKVDKLCVMVRATSFDKLRFVQCLKQKGHVVVATGNSTSDAPTLREADVGIHMGFLGNSTAVENSDIIVLNEGFGSVFTVLKVWRAIYDNIKVFIQYSLAANLASFVTDSLSTICAGFGGQPPTIDILASVSAKQIPYVVLQILWVKLVIGTLAALALVVEQKTEDFMQEPPARPDQPPISNKIWKNILIDALYEIAILLTLQFEGQKIFGLNGNVKDTLVFNLVVLFQVFAILKARKPVVNTLKGIKRRKLFWAIICGIVILQVAMVETLALVAGTGNLNGWQWAACFGVAFTSWPVEYIGSKYIPDPKMPFTV